MGFPETLDGQIVLALKVISVFFALQVFWPRNGYRLRILRRITTFFASLAAFAVLTLWSHALSEAKGSLSPIAWFSCQEGEAPWCSLRGTAFAETPEKEEPRKKEERKESGEKDELDKDEWQRDNVWPEEDAWPEDKELYGDDEWPD